jgi:hypothetical protein
MPQPYFRPVIIDNFNVKGMPVTPPEADPPLLVDPDAVLALSVALQSLELIRASNRQVSTRPNIESIERPVEFDLR